VLGATDDEIVSQSKDWSELVTIQKLQMDQEHVYSEDFIEHQNSITHIRINIYPDGGIARLKLIGTYTNP
jgi:allantoicase